MPNRHSGPIDTPRVTFQPVGPGAERSGDSQDFGRGHDDDKRSASRLHGSVVSHLAAQADEQTFQEHAFGQSALAFDAQIGFEEPVVDLLGSGTSDAS